MFNFHIIFRQALLSLIFLVAAFGTIAFFIHDNIHILQPVVILIFGAVFFVQLLSVLGLRKIAISGKLKSKLRVDILVSLFFIFAQINWFLSTFDNPPPVVGFEASMAWLSLALLALSNGEVFLALPKKSIASLVREESDS